MAPSSKRVSMKLNQFDNLTIVDPVFTGKMELIHCGFVKQQ
jgi:hypothetical protein